MTSEIEVKKETPENQISIVMQNVQLVHTLLKSVMKENEHYGKIQGCRDTLVLLKSGAEKLAVLFQLRPSFIVNQKDFDNDHREYSVTCVLSNRNGEVIAEGVGCCSTKETKYRYRTELTDREVPKEYWATRNPLLLEGGVVKKIGNKWAIAIRVETSPADSYNTCLKMAKKRAFVDAVITATAASDIFTQDLEEEAETAPQAPVDESLEQASFPMPSPKTSKVISEAQRKLIFAKSQEAGMTKEELKVLIASFGYETTADIEKDKIDQILETIDHYKRVKSGKTDE